MTQRLFHLPIGVNPIAAAMPHLVYLLLGIHVAGKVICKQEPVSPVANLPFHCTLFEHAVTSLNS